MCQHVFLFKLIGLPCSAPSARCFPTRKNTHSETEMLIDDRHCPMRKPGCGPLMCILSETCLKSFIRGRKSSVLPPPHTHTEVIDRNSHKHTAGTWSKTVILIPFWAYGYTPNRPPPLFFTFTLNTHEQAWLRLRGAAPAEHINCCIIVSGELFNLQNDPTEL